MCRYWDGEAIARVAKVCDVLRGLASNYKAIPPIQRCAVADSILMRMKGGVCVCVGCWVSDVCLWFGVCRWFSVFLGFGVCVFGLVCV